LDLEDAKGYRLNASVHFDPGTLSDTEAIVSGGDKPQREIRLKDAEREVREGC